ncbi:ribosome small subunit-dependent GTPase A [Ancylomarina euxinus]|uniref:Small ribosomal subunit biogenesis GTPase RsgA n=1 Tax=Ancylomarina euxinus TaxID=2283627 RepID=A0A425Y446_9BACT|nr:ribosome small subunit-dependent GTPase A [Ancylomarina euxinus]MCZ4694603.1 ribosome small subunit-dependent GTPase A [Ancylomarina euxinus]MUP14146.1 ribosome small subunit-dependent GTPase A [Ancylomarina euxinus]RRG23002.1 ribosome small subunit-dependent GTPase A [Ancylomarina euxinus]
MRLEDLGYHTELENYRKDQNLDSFGVGRVISEHKERYIVKTTEKEYDGEIIGNLRFSASKRSDFPAVGDWVAISEYDEDKVLIHAVFPRQTIIERQSVGKQGEKQIIASNIDYAFIVQAVDRDFSINRIERYLTICNTSKVKPIVILNKIDLVSEAELTKMISSLHERVHSAPILAISNESHKGIEELKQIIEKAKTYCLLGSSGVGKSTLLNHLLGKDLMRTAAISESSNRGRHITSHREMHILENGGIIIDNPGMREVGIADSASGLEITFETIVALSKRCKFKDCTHTTETGCVLVAALESGEIDSLSYENYLRMEREKEHFESTVAERRKKDKDFGKMIKNYKKGKKNKKN